MRLSLRRWDRRSDLHTFFFSAGIYELIVHHHYAVGREMPRIYLKRTVALSLTLGSLCLLLIFLFIQDQHGRSEKIKREEEEKLYYELLKEAQTVRPVPTTKRPAPEIHMKKLAPLSINTNWTAKMMEYTFYKYLENKDIRCENDLRLGNWHDGGWNVCLSPPYKMADPCVVFSFGIGNDWQFDDAISTMYGCRVLAFDPSMSEPSSRRSPLIEFRRSGLGPANTVNKEGWQMKTLATHIRDEGYWGEDVDYMKIDIEYSEWSVLEQAFQDEGTFTHVKQLGIEIHTPDLFSIYGKDHVSAAKDIDNFDPLKSFYDLAKTPHADKRRTFVHMFETLHRLEILGFRKFNYRKNPFGNFRSNITGYEKSCCYELHYVNINYLTQNDTVLHYKDDKLFH